MGRLPHFVPSLIILAVILCLTLLPVPDKVVDVPLFPGADKVVHFLDVWNSCSDIMVG